jgi:hypothetical protein
MRYALIYRGSIFEILRIPPDVLEKQSFALFNSRCGRGSTYVFKILLEVVIFEYLRFVEKLLAEVQLGHLFLLFRSQLANVAYFDLLRRRFALLTISEALALILELLDGIKLPVRYYDTGPVIDDLWLLLKSAV